MLNDETVGSFTEIANQLPRINGKRVHCASLWRWARRGIQGHKLETRRLGGRFCTSLEAVDRFCKALAEIELEPRPRGTQVEPATPRGRTPQQRAKDVARARRELVKAGI
jgi:hypothetical protein